jgi:hypothetical protein
MVAKVPSNGVNLTDFTVSGTTPFITIGDAGAEDAGIIFDGNAQDFYIALDDSADDLLIGTGASVGSNTKMVIENGGNVGIGTTAPDENLHVETSSGDCDAKVYAAEDASGSDARLFLKTNNTSATPTIFFGDSANDSIGFIKYKNNGNSMALGTSSAERMTISSAGTITCVTGNEGWNFDPSVDSFYPNTNDNNDLGYANLKWDDVYATNGTIQTSDKNVKDNITTSDLGLDFVNKLKPVSYKFKSKTRTHYGLIAQDIEEVLSDISKSSTNFAGFVKIQKEDHSLWTEEDKTANPDDFAGETPKYGVGEKKMGQKIDGEYSYGLRYEEFISPMIKAIQELATKVKALEDA